MDSLATNQGVSPRTGLPVLPTTAEDELYLGYLKAFLVDRERECRESERLG